MVMGHGRHGKGTFCEIAARYGIKSMGSSRYACDTFLFEQLKDTYGYADAESCYQDRHRDDAMRQVWYQAIFDYNTPDRTRLGRGIFSVASIYDGVRDDQEFLALKEANAFDLAIWVDASERLPKEAATSIKVGMEHADIVIMNNGTPEAYERSVKALLKALFNIT